MCAAWQHLDLSLPVAQNQVPAQELFTDAVLQAGGGKLLALHAWITHNSLLRDESQWIKGSFFP